MFRDNKVINAKDVLELTQHSAQSWNPRIVNHVSSFPTILTASSLCYFSIKYLYVESMLNANLTDHWTHCHAYFHAFQKTLERFPGLDSHDFFLRSHAKRFLIKNFFAQAFLFDLVLYFRLCTYLTSLLALNLKWKSLIDRIDCERYSQHRALRFFSQDRRSSGFGGAKIADNYLWFTRDFCVPHLGYRESRASTPLFVPWRSRIQPPSVCIWWLDRSTERWTSFVHL